MKTDFLWIISDNLSASLPSPELNSNNVTSFKEKITARVISAVVWLH